jgi:hypothetical protein
MKTGSFNRMRYAAFAAALSLLGLCAPVPSAFGQAQSETDLQNCHISATGDMICDGTENGAEVGTGPALGTLHTDTDTGTTTTPTVSGSVIVSNPNTCDGIQTISLGASTATIQNGTATLTFESEAPYRAGDRLTVTGANDANFNGSYTVSSVSGNSVSFKLADGAGAESSVGGAIYATGDVADNAETDIDKCQTIDTETAEQQQQELDQLQQQIDQLQQLLTQLQQQMTNQTLAQQQQAAQALQQAQSSGGSQGLLGMLQQILSGKTPTMPGTNMASTGTFTGPTTQEQQTADEKGKEDNGVDFTKEFNADDPLCDLNRNDPVGSRPLEAAVNQEIVFRFSNKDPVADMKNNVVVGVNGKFDAGVGKATGAYHATAVGAGFMLDDRGGINAAISAAKSINSALSKVPQNKLDHCFTTVLASAAYAYPNLNQLLATAIQLANEGKYDKAAELASSAVGGGKLGEDVSKAFKSLGSTVQQNEGLKEGSSSNANANANANSNANNSGNSANGGSNNGNTGGNGTANPVTAGNGGTGSANSGGNSSETNKPPSDVPSGSTVFTPPTGSKFPALGTGETAYQAPDGSVYYTSPYQGTVVYDSAGNEISRRI